MDWKADKHAMEVLIFGKLKREVSLRFCAKAMPKTLRIVWQQLFRVGVVDWVGALVEQIVVFHGMVRT